MSDGRSLFHGWRARTHYLTRDRRFLLRTALGIIALGMIIASAIVSSTRQPNLYSVAFAMNPARNQVRVEYQNLRHTSEPQPRELATWLRRALALIGNDDVGNEYAEYESTGLLDGHDVRVLIDRHATTDAPAGLFRAFLAAALAADADAMRQLAAAAQGKPPAFLANELLGSVQKRHGETAAAMQSFYTEGLHFADAKAAREEALRLSVTLKDLEQLRLIAAQPGWVEACHPLLQHHAGALLGDIWMQWRGLLHHRLAEVPFSMLVLAIFATGLWYVILVQHSDREHWHWVRPMPAIVAGVCSVWPTLSVLAYQEFVQGMTADAPFPHDLIYYLAGVGLREEGCKLALFAFLLPWLLWRRKPGLALLSGAFVGLGFSLAENIGYYQDYGGGIAWTRFLSANFLHISLTGVCGHSLYNMLRTRFARADEFIATFIAAVAVHGGYDWLGTNPIDDNGWLSIVVLVLAVARFIDLLAAETRPVRLTVAPRAIFTLGSAVLIAIAFVLGAQATGSMEGVSKAGMECLSMVPIAVLYWRKFENI